MSISDCVHVDYHWLTGPLPNCTPLRYLTDHSNWPPSANWYPRYHPTSMLRTAIKFSEHPSDLTAHVLVTTYWQTPLRWLTHDPLLILNDPRVIGVPLCCGQLLNSANTPAIWLLTCWLPLTDCMFLTERENKIPFKIQKTKSYSNRG